MGEVVGPHLPDSALPVPDPLPDWVKNIFPFSFPKGKEKVTAENQTDLLGFYLTALMTKEHFQNDITVSVIVLNLGALVCIENVLQNERMETVAISEPLNGFNVTDAVDIDPGHGRLILEDKAFLGGNDLLFQDMRLIIVKEGDLCHPLFFLTDVDETPWRKTGFFRSFLDESRHPCHPPINCRSQIEKSVTVWSQI
jgi:hypothetical protein